jgi:hypothetical protein
MDDSYLRQQLRAFIFWDVMERNFSGPGRVLSFDGDHQDWHLLGDAMSAMRQEFGSHPFGEYSEFKCWWLLQREVVYQRWGLKQRGLLDALYKYLNDFYLHLEYGWDEPRPGWRDSCHPLDRVSSVWRRGFFGPPSWFPKWLLW